MRDIVVIAHNIRSTHNVGAIFRTCEGLGISRIILSGYTPYPTLPDDTRLPHLSRKITEQIHKTALNAEALVSFTYADQPPLAELKQQGYAVVGLEQDDRSILLSDYQPPQKIALLLGEEVEGITSELRAKCDALIELPMFGKKESFNVSVATGMALYGLRTAA